MKKIALIEDDLILSDTVFDILVEHEYSVRQLFSILDARDAIYEERFDLIILDITLPDGNGFDYAKELRSDGVSTPILFLTSRADSHSVSIGFESGGDDYVKKPFEPIELLARIDNLIRRSFFHTKSKYINIDDNYKFEPIKDVVYTTNNQPIQLYTKEIGIVKLLIERKGQIVTYDDFFVSVWNYDEEPTFETLRAHIKNLRHKMPLLNIDTVRTVGYRLA